MSHNQILDKLTAFLNNHTPMTEECQVVYFMVEVRKILDHEGSKNFPLLRFYCDWTVHTEKDRITPEIRMIAQELFNEAKNICEQKASNQALINNFIYMEGIKSELNIFLRDRGISTDLIKKKNWIPFIALLVKVLENQPINLPIKEVQILAFTPAAPGCVWCTVLFTNNINGKGYVQFGNAY